MHIALFEAQGDKLGIYKARFCIVYNIKKPGESNIFDIFLIYSQLI